MLLLALPGALSARADTVADFYQGKILRFVVGSAAGGGFDRYARMLAPHLSRATGATVIVVNRPGGGGKIAINQVARGEPDGLTIMIINGTPAALGQITDAVAVRFDMRELVYLGRVTAEPWMLLVSAASPYRSVADLVAASNGGKVIKFAGMTRVDGPTDSASVACEALKLNCKILVGFRSAREAALAVMRGDAEGFSVTDRGARDYSSGGLLIPIAVLARDRSAKLPDVPTIFEATLLGPEAAFWIDFRARIAEIGRTLITTPGTPEARVRYLRRAVERVLTDPDVAAEADRKKLPIRFASGEAAEAIVGDVFAGLPEERLRAVRHVLVEKYF